MLFGRLAGTKLGVTVTVSGTVAVGGLLLAALAGCRDVQVFTKDGETPERPIGDACTVDAQCVSGRCVAGVCDDGGCTRDPDCRDDELCVLRECRPVDEFACTPEQRPIMAIQPTGLAVDFGQVRIGEVGEETVTVENVGTCLLTLSSAGLATDNSGFSCEPCDPSAYPQRVPPGQSLDIIVRYSPQSPGEASNTLLIRSDDATVGDNGLLSVALHAAYDGVPSLVVEPLELNFGFVPQGQTRTLNLAVTNRGTGNAALVIDQLFVNNPINFTAAVNAAQNNQIVIPPFDANNPDATLLVPVTFAPGTGQGSLANFSANLIVHANDGTAAGVNVPVPMTGSSLGPPQISVSTTELTYKCGVGTNGVQDVCPTNEAYPVGVVTFRTVTISNNLGQSPLTVSLTLGGEAGDFSVSPTFIPPIPAGGSVPVSVFFNPSAPSDPANRLNPVEPFDAVLNITSDDTDDSDNDGRPDVLKTVVLKGFSRGGQNDQVLKLEMEYQNADNSWAGNDFRDVDLELESPLGFSCSKPIRQYAPDGQGGFIVASTEDLCDEWTATGLEGQANWIALGQFEEPERVVLFGLGPTGAEGGVFTPRVYYIEDCANIPTGLLADIIGISGSILLGVLGGAVGVPIAVPPDQISDFVGENCFDHAGSTVTLHISLDGEEVAAPQVRLDAKGDVVEMAHLRRTQGVFCDNDVGIPCP